MRVQCDWLRTVAFVCMVLLWGGHTCRRGLRRTVLAAAASPDCWTTTELSEVWSEVQVLSVRTDFRYWPLVVLRRDQQSGGWHRQLLSKL